MYVCKSASIRVLVVRGGTYQFGTVVSVHTYQWARLRKACVSLYVSVCVFVCVCVYKHVSLSISLCPRQVMSTVFSLDVRLRSETLVNNTTVTGPNTHTHSPTHTHSLSLTHTHSDTFICSLFQSVIIFPSKIYAHPYRFVHMYEAFICSCFDTCSTAHLHGHTCP